MEKKPKNGRPKLAEKERLDRRIAFAVTKQEHEMLTERAKKSGVKIGIYAREMSLKGKVEERLNKEEIAIMRETNHVINNLNQLSKAFNYFVKEGNIIDLAKRKIEIDKIIENLNIIQNKVW